MQLGCSDEEFEVGATYKHWPGKTVTESDDHLFCLLTMNHHPLHLDAHYAEETTQFGKNVVVGNYVYSILLGMSVPDISGKAIANLEIESLRHVAPTFHGDTLYGETTVLDKWESKSKDDRGVVHVETIGYNQDGKVVCIFRRKVMVPKNNYLEERGGEQPGRPVPQPEELAWLRRHLPSSRGVTAGSFSSPALPAPPPDLRPGCHQPTRRPARSGAAGCVPRWQSRRRTQRKGEPEPEGQLRPAPDQAHDPPPPSADAERHLGVHTATKALRRPAEPGMPQSSNGPFPLVGRPAKSHTRGVARSTRRRSQRGCRIPGRQSRRGSPRRASPNQRPPMGRSPLGRGVPFRGQGDGPEASESRPRGWLALANCAVGER